MMTYEQIRHSEVKKNYIEFLESFGLKTPNNIDEIVDYDGNIHIESLKHKNTESRKQAIRVYKETCRAFKLNVTSRLDEMSEAEIMDYAVRNINAEVKKRFGERLQQIENVVSRKHVRDAIQILFDQCNYISAEEVEQLIAVCDDNEALVEAYEGLGGEPGCFTPSEYTENEDEGVEDEDYIEGDEEDEEW